jgi:small subunit ribosomal protein S3
MENPHVDIAEIKNPDLNAQLVADNIALSLERFGSLRFKSIAYKVLTKMKTEGALGGEIVMSGRLPSERAKTWRFKFGFLKKTGDASNDVDYAESVGQDKQGVVGIKVSILTPETLASEEVTVTPELISKLKQNITFTQEKPNKEKKK